MSEDQMGKQSLIARIVAIVAIMATMLVWVGPAAAEPIGNDAFMRTWARTDKPVADGAVTRSWMWGPEAYTGVMTENYASEYGQSRQVQYFDKSRMEITNPGGDPSSQWYVSNGLLARELITGQMQVGDNSWENRAPAVVNVAGDPGETSETTPTYASMAVRVQAPANEVGSPVVRQISRSGGSFVGTEDNFVGYNVTHAFYVPETKHTVASPFWDFLNTTGPIYQDGTSTIGQIFDPWFYATGYPITEPYWSVVKVGGTEKDVLVQCFERRCLTYTPSNSPEWQVEMGNVGQHYYRWRYEEWPGDMPAEGATLYQSSLEDWAVYPDTEWVDGAFQYTVGPGANPSTGIFSGGAFWTSNEQPGGFQNISASIDIRAVAPTPTDGSLTTEACLFARGEPSRPQHRYELCIDQSGRFRAYFGSEDPNDQPVLLFDSRWVDRDGVFDWHRLTIVSNGATMWFLVNGNVIATAVDDTYTSGQVGFEVVNYSTGTVAWQFRNLEVRALQ